METVFRDDPTRMMLFYQEEIGSMFDMLEGLKKEEIFNFSQIIDIVWNHLSNFMELDVGIAISYGSGNLKYSAKVDKKDILKNYVTLDKESKEILHTLLDNIMICKSHEDQKNNDYVDHYNYKDNVPLFIQGKKDQQAFVVEYICDLPDQVRIFFIFIRNKKNKPFLDYELIAIRLSSRIISWYIKYTFLDQKLLYFFHETSAHTFEKCYNTPLRNLCYRLRQFIHPYNHRARAITYTIQDFIELWGNEFAVKTHMGRPESNKEWIEWFYWNDFRSDLIYFAQHFFYLTINNLYDHFNPSKFHPDVLPMEKIWDGSLSWENFIDIEFEPSTKKSEFDPKMEIIILGIRPFFRVILINLLQNAIESINLFKISQQGLTKDNKAKIRFSATQDEESTIISCESAGQPMKPHLLNKFKNVFASAAEGNLHLYSGEWIDKIRNKEFTSKPGTGSGRALIETALYLSRIGRYENGTEAEKGWMEVSSENEITTFKLCLPYGKKLAESCFDHPYEFQKMDNRVSFKWNIFRR